MQHSSNLDEASQKDPSAVNDETPPIHNILCRMCPFESNGKILLENHQDEDHAQQPSSNIEENFPKAPSVEKPKPLYKCNECYFTTITTDDLKEHKEAEH